MVIESVPVVVYCASHVPPIPTSTPSVQTWKARSGLGTRLASYNIITNCVIVILKKTFGFSDSRVLRTPSPTIGLVTRLSQSLFSFAVADRQ